MATGPVDIALGTPAPDFRLLATDGRTYALKDVAGGKGTVIVFICNHCPYVKAVIRPARRRRPRPPGAREQASPPSARTTPQAIRRTPSRRWPNSPSATISRFPIFTMKARTLPAPMGRSAPPTSSASDRDLKLKYRGRLDEGRTATPPPGARRRLVEAMRAIAATGVARGELKSRRSDVRSSGGRRTADGRRIARDR